MNDTPGLSPLPLPPPEPLHRSPLDRFDREHGAQMVAFAGWEMPLHFGGIVEEHVAVRTGAGLFDVSHMGILTVRGRSAPALLSRRTTANVGKLTPGQCRYSFLLDGEGLIVDDLILTRFDAGGEQEPAFLVVPNAARATRVFDLLREHRRPDTEVLRHNGAVAILAVQGPRCGTLLRASTGWSVERLAPFHAEFFSLPTGPTADAGPRLGLPFPASLGESVLVSRTGYTGEMGFELFVGAVQAPAVADRLISEGARPCGLGARDTLRLEKGYLLSGQDFGDDRTPLEAGQERFVEFDHPFVGRDALEKQTRDGVPVHLAGVRVRNPTVIPRHGSPLFHEGRAVAVVTSGGFSPTLKTGIALAYLPTALARPGVRLELEVRERRAAAEVVPLPFVPGARPNA